MVTELILDLLGWILTALLDLLPEWDIEGSWVISATGTLTDIVGYAAQLSNWFPMGAIVDVTFAILIATAVLFALRITRIVLSFLSAGGGSAA